MNSLSALSVTIAGSGISTDLISAKSGKSIRILQLLCCGTANDTVSITYTVAGVSTTAKVRVLANTSQPFPASGVSWSLADVGTAVTFIAATTTTITAYYTQSYGQSWTLPQESGSWKYRRKITYSNAGGSATAKGIQVNIALDSTFNYAACLSGGVDIRVTDSNGSTILPYFIESWNSGTSASIWFKVDIPDTANHIAYLYYGNPAGTPVAPAATATAPIGPFTHSDTFITPSGAGAQTFIVPENILLDGGTYYAIVEDRHASPFTVGLMHTSDPSLTTGWTWDGTMITGGATNWQSPFLAKVGSTYYILVWNGTTQSIYLYSASAVTGAYTSAGEILPVGGVGAWDHGTVFEPGLVQNYDGNGNFLMTYTGSSSTPAEGDERTGYATASAITGPWTKYASNPILPFGPAGSVDTKATSDAWVVNLAGVWYIGYTSTSTAGTSIAPAAQSYATTTDWVNFTFHHGKQYIAPGAGNRWDRESAYRGHPILVGTKWVQLYAGTTTPTYTVINTGVATAPATAVQDIRNNADAVFDFWDGFDDASLNANKWTVDPNFNATLASSIIDINASHAATSMYMASSTAFGTNVVLEVYARWKTAVSTSTNALEVCLSGSDLNAATANGLRMVSFDNASFEAVKYVNGVYTAEAISGATLDTASYHKTQIYWDGTTATYKLDSHSATWTPALTYNALQAVIYPAFVSAFPEILIDWIRIRQWPGAECVVNVG